MYTSRVYMAGQFFKDFYETQTTLLSNSLGSSSTVFKELSWQINLQSSQ